MLVLQLVDISDDDIAQRADWEILVAEVLIELQVRAGCPELCGTWMFWMGCAVHLK